MRTAVQERTQGTGRSRSVPMPAPTGGWNARDGLATMPITDAETLVNWFAETTDVRIRSGSSNHVTGLPGQVESLMVFKSPTAEKMFAASGTAFYDVSTAGAVGSAVVSGLTNARWFDTNFETSGGNFLIVANGEDAPRTYDGTTWAAYSASGPTVANLIYPFQFKQRLFFIEKDSQSIWYNNAVNTIGGTLVEFPLGSQMELGGKLLCAGTWTRDGGSGADDFLAIITDAGEVIVYQGTDPSSATTWAQVGVYRVPVPLSRRCLQKWGGDLLMALEAGVFPMSSVLSGLEIQSGLSDKIRTRVSQSVAVYRNNFGWELSYYPDGRWLILNVPVNEGSDQEQYVMNTNTAAWCQFKGLDANCWKVFSGGCYFGGNTVVVQANTGTNDNGTDIQVDLKQAPNNFGTATIKRFLQCMPHIASDGDLPLEFGLNTDFSNTAPTSVPTPSLINFAAWGEADWDDFDWGDDPQPVGGWQGLTGIGTYAALRMKGATNSESIQFFGAEMVMEDGGIV